MVKKHLIPVLVILLWSSAGCWDLQEINDKAVTTSIGIDLEENNKVRFSSLYISPSIPGGETGAAQTKPTLTTASDYSVAMAARKMMLSLSKVPEFAHIRSLILGDNLVSNNLTLSVDFLLRNRNISEVANLLISVGSRPEEILASINSTDRALQQLIAVNEFEAGIYIPVTLVDFTYKLLTPGIEPTIPQIMIQETKSINKSSSSQDQTENPSGESKRLVLHGTAVFKKDKKIGVLNEYESRGLRWLNSNKKTGGIILIQSPLNPKEYTALEILHFMSETRPQVNGKQIKMQISIKTRLALYENTSIVNNISKDTLKKMEQAANQEISRQIISCIHKSQSLNSDVLGWGLLLLQYQPDTWKQVKGDWNHLFPLVEYDVQAETSIIHTYLSK